MKQCNNETMKRGVSIFLALVIMAVLLGIGLGLGAILVGQIKTFRGIGNSVVAFYAADTGIEWALYQDKKACRQASCPSFCEASCDVGILSGTYHGFLDIDGDGTTGDPSTDSCPDALSTYPADACYEITVDTITGEWESLGVYQGVRRAIQVSF